MIRATAHKKFINCLRLIAAMRFESAVVAMPISIYFRSFVDQFFRVPLSASDGHCICKRTRCDGRRLCRSVHARRIYDFVMVGLAAREFGDQDKGSNAPDVGRRASHNRRERRDKKKKPGTAGLFKFVFLSMDQIISRAWRSDAPDATPSGSRCSCERCCIEPPASIPVLRS